MAGCGWMAYGLRRNVKTAEYPAYAHSFTTSPGGAATRRLPRLAKSR